MIKIDFEGLNERDINGIYSLFATLDYNKKAINDLFIFADGSNIGFNAFGENGLLAVMESVCDYLLQRVSEDINEYSKILLDYAGYLHNRLTLEQRMVYIDKYLANNNEKFSGRKG